MSQLHIVAFAGSTRKDSYNKVLVRLAAEMAEEAGARVTLLDLADLSDRLTRVQLFDIGRPQELDRLGLAPGRGGRLRLRRENGAPHQCFPRSARWASWTQPPERRTHESGSLHQQQATGFPEST